MIIFLDMDGVLAEFFKGAVELFGLSPEAVLIAEADCDRMHEVAGISEKEFWKRIDEAGPQWWENLPLCPWANRLVEACSGVAEVYIATSPPRTVTAAAAGKLAWIRDFLPDIYAGRRYFIGSHKHLLAAPGRVLVDDDAKKCKAFSDAGGRAVLFPRPWNLVHLPPGATPDALIEGIEQNGAFDGHLR